MRLVASKAAPSKNAFDIEASRMSAFEKLALQEMVFRRSAWKRRARWNRADSR